MFAAINFNCSKATKKHDFWILKFDFYLFLALFSRFFSKKMIEFDMWTNKWQSPTLWKSSKSLKQWFQSIVANRMPSSAVDQDFCHCVWVLTWTKQASNSLYQKRYLQTSHMSSSFLWKKVVLLFARLKISPKATVCHTKLRSKPGFDKLMVSPTRGLPHTGWFCWRSTKPDRQNLTIAEPTGKTAT